MGKPYLRGKLWWIGFTDAAGRRVYRSTGSSELATAEKILAEVERQVKRELSASGGAGPLTVEAYATQWIQKRKARKVASAKDDDARLKHALPKLGHLLVAEVEKQHVKELLRDLMAVKDESRLAPRTILHVYSVLRLLFDDAVDEGLVEKTPCTLRAKKKELPRKKDKDPTWRATAIYSEQEAWTLLFDPELAPDRRVLFAGLFLGGMRIGEWVIRRWRDYNPTRKPLGELSVATAWNSVDRIEKETKAEAPRVVPVHPTLAAILAEWKLSGWQRLMGRAPGPDDLIIPSREKRVRSNKMGLKAIRSESEKRGWAARRQHDTRRTFITMLREAGVDKDTIHVITHGVQGADEKAIIDTYTSIRWRVLCDVVLKLELYPRSLEALRLRAAANGEAMHDLDDASGTTGALQPDSENENAAKSEDLAASIQRGVRDLNPTRARSDLGAKGQDSRGCGSASAASGGGAGSDCSTGTTDEPPESEAHPRSYLSLARWAGFEVVVGGRSR